MTRGFWMAAVRSHAGRNGRVVGTRPDRPPTPQFGVGDTFPMYWVNYSGAETFCRQVTERAQSIGALPAGWEFRLPTEAQWEYACRAGTTTATSFGDALAGAIRRTSEAAPAAGRPATPVGSYPPIAWGLYDMHGNIFEWCRDWYHARLPGGVDPDLTDERRAQPAMVPTRASAAAAPGTTTPRSAVRRCGCATNPNGVRSHRLSRRGRADLLTRVVSSRTCR